MPGLKPRPTKPGLPICPAYRFDLPNLACESIAQGYFEGALMPGLKRRRKNSELRIGLAKTSLRG
jgi:hypothetical protein